MNAANTMDAMAAANAMDTANPRSRPNQVRRGGAGTASIEADTRHTATPDAGEQRRRQGMRNT